MVGRRSFLKQALAGLGALVGLGGIAKAKVPQDLSKLLVGENAKRWKQLTPLSISENHRTGWIRFSDDLNLKNVDHLRFYNERIAWHVGHPEKGYQRQSCSYTIGGDLKTYEYAIVDQEMTKIIVGFPKMKGSA